MHGMEAKPAPLYFLSNKTISCIAPPTPSVDQCMPDCNTPRQPSPAAEAAAESGPGTPPSSFRRKAAEEKSRDLLSPSAETGDTHPFPPPSGTAKIIFSKYRGSHEGSPPVLSLCWVWTTCAGDKGSLHRDPAGIGARNRAGMPFIFRFEAATFPRRLTGACDPLLPLPGIGRSGRWAPVFSVRRWPSRPCRWPCTPRSVPVHCLAVRAAWRATPGCVRPSQRRDDRWQRCLPSN